MWKKASALCLNAAATPSLKIRTRILKSNANAKEKNTTLCTTE